MTIEKLKQKTIRYQEEGAVALSPKPFERLCELAIPAKATHDSAQAERSITAKLFAIIGGQGKTSAATALFQTKAQVAALEHVSWDDIDWYANHPARSSISSMYNGLGFPVRTDVEQLDAWVETNSSPSQTRRLLSSITGMQAGRGVPKTTELDSLRRWCVEKSPSAWQKLFSSVCVMQMGCGLPNQSTLVELEALYSILEGPELRLWLVTYLREIPIPERLIELRERLTECGFSNVSLPRLYAMLPPELCPGFTKQDLSPACVRLEIPDQTVFLSSGEERVVAYLLHKYGLIKQFVEGENLHVRTGTSHRIDLDFLLDEIKLFIEYHPLSQRDRKEGRSLEEAGARKIESVFGGTYHDYHVLHIARLSELLPAFTEHPRIAPRIAQHLGEKLSREQFIRDLKEAIRYGHEINERLAEARERCPLAVTQEETRTPSAA